MKTVLAFLLAVAPASGAIAGLPSTVQAPTATVRFGDLNLSDPAGAATLRSRIDATIVRLSGESRDRVDALNGQQIAMAKARKQGRAQADGLIAAANARPRSPQAAAS